MGRKPVARKRLNKPVAKVANGHANGHINGKTNSIGEGYNTPANRSTRNSVNRYHNSAESTYKPEYVQEVAKLVLHGYMEREMIAHFKVTRTVFRQWQLQYPEFAAAMTITADASLADQRVVRSMFEMANGYVQPAMKIFMHEGEVTKVKYKEHVAKNFNAGKFWLANRDPLRWGRDPDRDAGKGSGNLPNVINIKMIRGMDTEQLHAALRVLQSIAKPNQNALTRLDLVEPVEDAEIVRVKAKKRVGKK